MDTLFSHATVVTMNDQMAVLPDAFVGVTGGKICYLSSEPPQEHPAQIIDATGRVMMPGLINAHTHLPMSILRGYADDYPLATWLNDHIFPREDRLDARCVKAATLLGIAECLRFGITSVSDMYNFTETVAEAVAESGMLQMGNIVRNPRIWIPAIAASAVTGPLATCLFHFEMNGAPVSSGMGTCGLVGPIGVYTGWVSDVAAGVKSAITATDWIGMALICFILPGVLTWAFGLICRKLGWIRENDLKLDA